MYVKRTGGRGGEGTDPGREEMPRPDSRREGGGGKRPRGPFSKGQSLLIASKAGMRTALSAG